MTRRRCFAIGVLAFCFAVACAGLDSPPLAQVRAQQTSRAFVGYLFPFSGRLTDSPVFTEGVRARVLLGLDPDDGALVYELQCASRAPVVAAHLSLTTGTGPTVAVLFGGAPVDTGPAAEALSRFRRITTGRLAASDLIGPLSTAGSLAPLVSALRAGQTAVTVQTNSAGLSPSADPFLLRGALSAVTPTQSYAWASPELRALVAGKAKARAVTDPTPVPISMFEPKGYMRGRGVPEPVTDTFAVRTPGITSMPRISNGSSTTQYARVLRTTVLRQQRRLHRHDHGNGMTRGDRNRLDGAGASPTRSGQHVCLSECVVVLPGSAIPEHHPIGEWPIPRLPASH